MLVLSPSIQASICPIANPSIPITECETLIAQYESTDGPNWPSENHRWNTPTEPCTCGGVRCTFNGRSNVVTRIHNNNSGWNGPLPAEIRNLHSLQDRHLQLNQLSGSIASRPLNGSVSFSRNGQAIYRPRLEFIGLDSFVYKLLDGIGGTDTARVSIVVKSGKGGIP